jgi:hypothetical protein
MQLDLAWCFGNNCLILYGKLPTSHIPSTQALEDNCTAIHVRRGNVGFPRHPFRRYTIVLLTDDETTIDKLKKYHSDDYNWVYLNRPRNKGVTGGFNGHTPSGDGAFGILSILAEVKLAGLCNKFVHGQSGFVIAIYHELDATGRNYTPVVLDTKFKPRRDEGMARQIL